MSQRPTATIAGCILLLASIAVTGCTSQDRQPGCTPPGNEKQLIEAYRDDPVFTTDPPATRRIDGPRSSTACRVLNREDTSSTGVTLTFEVTRAHTRDDLIAAYDGDVRGRGWIPVPVGLAGPTRAGEAHLAYCKLILDVPAFLSVDSVPGGAQKDARLVVSIIAMPERPCPPGT